MHGELQRMEERESGTCTMVYPKVSGLSRNEI
jgi:hypothetical protein